jgi:hypothetical protein
MNVEKTSWVIGSRKPFSGLRRKRIVSSCEQQNKHRVLKYLPFIRCIAINHSNPLLTHFMNKKTEGNSFSKIIGLFKCPVTWLPARTEMNNGLRTMITFYKTIIFASSSTFSSTFTKYFFKTQYKQASYIVSWAYRTRFWGVRAEGKE